MIQVVGMKKKTDCQEILLETDISEVEIAENGNLLNIVEDILEKNKDVEKK